MLMMRGGLAALGRYRLNLTEQALFEAAFAGKPAPTGNHASHALRRSWLASDGR
jgi:hypothetical protein